MNESPPLHAHFLPSPSDFSIVTDRNPLEFKINCTSQSQTPLIVYFYFILNYTYIHIIIYIFGYITERALTVDYTSPAHFLGVD